MEEMVMDSFEFYPHAAERARADANAFQLDVAIRKVKEYGRLRYVVTFASRNDSDYATAEIVRPDPIRSGK